MAVLATHEGCSLSRQKSKSQEARLDPWGGELAPVERASLGPEEVSSGLARQGSGSRVGPSPGFLGVYSCSWDHPMR